MHILLINMDLQRIKSVLQEEKIDLWLLYDFRGSNSIAWQMAAIEPDAHCTRRWAIGIPACGEPFKIVHAIEHFTLGNVEARQIIYSNKEEWQQNLCEIAAKYPVIAMEYSPDNAIPVVSKVDAGTIEFIRANGGNIVSSANLVQKIYAVWSDGQYEENLRHTAPKLRESMFSAFDFLRRQIVNKYKVTEYDVQQHILSEFVKFGLVTDSPPIVAVARNAASPHYAPSAEIHAVIPRDELVLIDMWAKTSDRNSTFSDITWMCYTGSNVPKRYEDIFSVVIGGRDAALDFVKKRLAEGCEVSGYEVDDAARNLITSKGYGKYFIHRTGHSITTETHGAGANMDNYETYDTRCIIPLTSFSIEPGIYIPNDVGMRSEISVVIASNGEVLTPSSPLQTSIEALLP